MNYWCKKEAENGSKNHTNAINISIFLNNPLGVIQTVNVGTQKLKIKIYTYL